MNKIELQDPKVASKIIAANAENDKRKAELGFLGRFFGSGENVRLYIVGTIALGVLLIALVYTLTPDRYRSPDLGLKDMWTLIVIPVESTIIGYLIGSRSKETGNG
ncbi:hypothetical protein I8J29_18655 [Paenibacillus sp. MWE-103]|uniref:Uncharacterized protein n=1 Tax=Paenibacillus artemisiicola TaxID=1172618 RepID=A0ABS3WD85_9BACL|nr:MULTISPECIES: hypothetical protein [Paenibacillus]MBO7746233.1 hypothetical protein [Paenibacillus artemisiicola]SFJ74121.1 hypothetical protein SAMN02799624_05771 [Paenibacillus sp. UNC496MF]